MKVYKLNTLEDFQNFISELAGRDQPVYVYQSSSNLNLVVFDVKPIENPDEEIDKFLETDEDDIIDENEPLFDYNDEDGLL